MLTKEIPRAEWPEFCDQFSRRHQGWLINLQVLGDELGAQVEGREVAFEGISTDKGKDHALSILVGRTPDEHLEQLRPYLELGFNHLVFHAPGQDQARFLRLYGEQILPRLRRQWA